MAVRGPPRSCRKKLVRWAEELVVDAVSRHARSGQSAHESPQETSRAAQEVVGLLQGGVLVQPVDADQAFLVVVLASPVLRPRLLVKGRNPDSAIGLRNQLPCPPAHGMGAPVLRAVDIVDGRTRVPRCDRL